MSLSWHQPVRSLVGDRRGRGHLERSVRVPKKDAFIDDSIGYHDWQIRHQGGKNGYQRNEIQVWNQRALGIHPAPGIWHRPVKWGPGSTPMSRRLFLQTGRCCAAKQGRGRCSGPGIPNPGCRVPFPAEGR
jgi:hypothetical protein